MPSPDRAQGNRRAGHGRSLHAPFGALEQRELEYLRAVGAGASEIGVLIVLRIREDGGSGIVRDTAARLASLCSMSLPSLKRRLAWFEGHGILRSEDRAGVNGSRGQWSRRRRVLAFADWPNNGSDVSQSSAEQRLTTEPKV